MKAIEMMRNMLDYLFMKSYSPKSLLSIKVNSRDEETRKISEEIPNIPNLVSINMNNNIIINNQLNELSQLVEELVLIIKK